MNERTKIKNSLMIMGIALTHTACNPQENANITPVESCPPITLPETSQKGAWLSMDIADEPFIIPISVDDPANLSNQAEVSLERVIPNEGVSVIIQMPNEEPKVGYIENDPSTALKFAQEIDIGMQFWACEDDDSAFFRLVPFDPPVQNPNA